MVPAMRRTPYFSGEYTPGLTAIAIQHSRGVLGVNGRTSDDFSSFVPISPLINFFMVSGFSGRIVV